MRGWRRSGDQVVASIERNEAQLLRGLVGQIRQILAARVAESPVDELSAITGIRAGPTTPPQDRVLARLLPEFHRDDATLAGGLRALHEPELIDAKDGVAAVVLRTCPADGGKVRLTMDEAQAWLSALNDVRLALGTVLEVTEDLPDELPPTDPRGPYLGVYHWLTYVQESLVHAVSGP
ncbi:MAG TPA: DUF2017 domain-containing protein [Pseudonocardiaceae bacterium]|nr:DUF2017 domain-containing protein [Pseudonocardiaceae bacterium]